MKYLISIAAHMSDLTQSPTQTEQGFSLFEALIAALILAIAVVGTMRLHNNNVQQTAGNAQLQHANRILNNAQQRYQMTQNLSDTDFQELRQQASQNGLKQYNLQINGTDIVLSWQAWSPDAIVTRGCAPANNANNNIDSCISVPVQ